MSTTAPGVIVDSLSAQENNFLKEFEKFWNLWAIIWAFCNVSFVYGIAMLDQYEGIYSSYFLTIFSHPFNQITRGNNLCFC